MLLLSRFPKTGSKKLFWPVFCFSLLQFAITTASQAKSACSTARIDAYVVVKKVYDGDTVRLSNGQKVRLIGINTPEMNYDKGSPDPLAREAKEFLSDALLNQKVGIRYGRDKKDKYKRSLAHVFLKDGTNVQALMLSEGLAFNIAVPPNLWQLDCYRHQEKTAIRQQKGIWQHPHYLPINADALHKGNLGFQQLTGTIKNIRETKRSYWLTLGKQVSLRIDKRDLKYFKEFEPKKWTGKKVKARGWISYRKKRYSMRLKHSAAIDFI